jgi:hypothetical protein
MTLPGNSVPASVSVHANWRSVLLPLSLSVATQPGRAKVYPGSRLFPFTLKIACMPADGVFGLTDTEVTDAVADAGGTETPAGVTGAEMPLVDVGMAPGASSPPLPHAAARNKTPASNMSSRNRIELISFTIYQKSVTRLSASRVRIPPCRKQFTGDRHAPVGAPPSIRSVAHAPNAAVDER